MRIQTRFQVACVAHESGTNITGNAATATSANNVTGTVAITNGGTGATSAAGARTNLGLGPLATLAPSGTADSTTYLKGDGVWTSLGGASTLSVGASTGTVAAGAAGRIYHYRTIEH